MTHMTRIALVAFLATTLPAAALADTTGGLPIRPLQAESGAPATLSDDESISQHIEKVHAAVKEAQRNLPAGAAGAPGVPPPPQITVKPGVHETQTISAKGLNRLRTPFHAPTIKTTARSSSAADTAVDGSVVYVDAFGGEPVSLYIMDKAAPDMAISLTLVPGNVQPVDVKLDVDGYDPALVMPPLESASEDGGSFDQPYVRAITGLFKSLALGEVPQGYGLTPIRDGRHPQMPVCAFGSVMLEPAQLLTGTDILTIVARAENIGYEHVAINESSCAGASLLAVAAWPRIELAPGEATEVYIAVRRPVATSGSRRPSVIGGAR